MVLHNPNDHLAAYSSGQQAYAQRTIVNQTDSALISDEAFGGVSCTQQDVGNGNPTVFCKNYATLLGDPHSWPTAGSQMIYDFFRGIENY